MGNFFLESLEKTNFLEREYILRQTKTWKKILYKINMYIHFDECFWEK